MVKSAKSKLWENLQDKIQSVQQRVERKSKIDQRGPNRVKRNLRNIPISCSIWMFFGLKYVKINKQKPQLK